MYGAIKQPDGKYSIVPAYPGYRSTFHIRNKLKTMGGIWDAQEGKWMGIKEEDLPKIPASKRLKVILEPHSNVSTVPMERLVFEHEIKNGQVSVLDWGDSHTWVDIQEICGEA